MRERDNFTAPAVMVKWCFSHPSRCCLASHYGQLLTHQSTNDRLKIAEILGLTKSYLQLAVLRFLLGSQPHGPCQNEWQPISKTRMSSIRHEYDSSATKYRFASARAYLNGHLMNIQGTLPRSSNECLRRGMSLHLVTFTNCKSTLFFQNLTLHLIRPYKLKRDSLYRVTFF